MTFERNKLDLPAYADFVEAIAVLALPFSASELHGTLCGYLCAGATVEGETYLRALSTNLKDEAARSAMLAMFNLYSISQEQIYNFDFEFEMLLPDDQESIKERALAFSEWCEGYTQGLASSGISLDMFDDEDAQDALQHISEFAELDYESLDVDEEDDEKALLEVSEFTRLAVLRLYGDLVMQHGGQTEITH